LTALGTEDIIVPFQPSNRKELGNSA